VKVSVAATSKPPLNPAPVVILHKMAARSDAENRKKRPKPKLSSTSNKVLNSRNDVGAVSAKAEPLKRKSGQMTAADCSANQDKESGCSAAKKPSPEHSVSVIRSSFFLMWIN